MKGFGDLTEEQRLECAELAHKAGLSFHDASYIWRLAQGACLLWLRTGVQVVIACPGK